MWCEGDVGLFGAEPDAPLWNSPIISNRSSAIDHQQSIISIYNTPCLSMLVVASAASRRFAARFLVAPLRFVLLEHRQPACVIIRRFSSTQSRSMASSITLLGQKDAQQIDVELMSTLGFSIDQLMELAGLSVAASVLKAYPSDKFGQVLVVCGPGNNGGDGLVAARHLRHFGYSPFIVYPKQSSGTLFTNLVTQCKSLDIPVEAELPKKFESSFQLILDGIFGFSFKGKIRAPFDVIVQSLIKSKIPIASIDIPSGWDVEKGDVEKVGMKADMLISLTTPKICAKFFQGRYHYLGGRFVPPTIVKKYKLVLPRYPGAEQCVLLPSFSSESQQNEDEKKSGKL